MEFLINPNVVYVLLVLGFMLALLAIVTPGSGVLEVGALILLVMAGYGLFKIGLNLWALLILVLSIVPFVYAIRKPKWYIYLSISLLGLIIGSLYIFPPDGWLPRVNPIVAAITSLFAVVSIWFVTRKTLQAHRKRPDHDLEALIGQIGETKTEIYASGSVQVAGELWSARSGKPIPVGRQVRVLAREGFILVVEPV